MTAKKSVKEKAPPSQPYSNVSLPSLNLLLDPQNPRLNPADRGAAQPRLIELMIERFDIAEIAESICTAGFLPLDPFIGYRDRGSVYILEGNRRLATIQLLLEPERAPAKHRQAWTAFQSRLTPQTVSELGEIPIRLYASRHNADVLAYIGYRHVNGVMSWDAEEKADFVARLIEDHDIGWSYEEIGDKLGSRPPYVERLYVAHRFIVQAQHEQVKGASKMRGKFGVLTRALQSPGIVGFLKIQFPNDPRRSRKPSKAAASRIEEFVRWTFGTDEDDPILEDSRDLTKWGRILQSAEAVQYLRNAREPLFDRAYAKCGGQEEGLIESLAAASTALAEAVPLVRAHRKSKEVQRVVDRCADYMSQILVHFGEIAKQQGISVENARNT